MTSAREVFPVVELRSGRTLDLGRPRSEGTLDQEELAYCRSHNIDLAYDPAQVGWVVGTCEDDLELKPSGGTGPLGLQPGHVAPLLGARGSHHRAQHLLRCAELVERYWFRPWRSSEVATFVSLLDNRRVWEHLPEEYPAPLTVDIARDLIELSNLGNHHEVLAVEFEGNVVGQVRLAFSRHSQNHAEAEISYWLGEPCWGRGIGTDLVSLYTYCSFRKRCELQSIFARVHKANAASARVLEKSHYHYEGEASDDPATRIFRVSRGDY